MLTYTVVVFLAGAYHGVWRAHDVPVGSIIGYDTLRGCRRMGAAPIVRDGRALGIRFKVRCVKEISQ